MTANDTDTVIHTRIKLRMLQERYAASSQEESDPHVRELTLRSLKRLINQLQEELARAEATVNSDQ